MIQRLFDRTLTLDRIHEAFLKHDPNFDNDIKAPKKRLGDLNVRLTNAQTAGHHLECAEQHYLEARWLLKYTDAWPNIDSALDEFDASLADLNQPDIVQAPDGSWGPCCHKFYRKLEPSVDALQIDNLDPAKLYPLTFMAPLQDPVWVANRLKNLQVSDIAQTGWNNRDEYGSMITSLSQLFFKKELLDLFANNPRLQFQVDQTAIDKYTQSLWAVQDDATGYWGPSYIFGSDHVMIPDLSFTFHVVHYYMEDSPMARFVPYLDKIFGTTLDIKGQDYPNGWLSSGQVTDHNKFDVGLILSFGWKDAPARQAEAATEIQRLSDDCLANSLDGDHFRHTDGQTPIEDYYYGVRFLDTIGLWDAQKRFWRTGDIPLPAGVPSPDHIRANLLSGFNKIKDGSDYSQTIGKILNAATTS